MIPQIQSVVMEALFDGETKQLATFHWAADVGVSYVLTTSDPSSRDLVEATVKAGVQSPDHRSMVRTSDGQQFMRALLSAGGTYVWFRDATTYTASAPAPTLREREIFEMLQAQQLILPVLDAKHAERKGVESTFMTTKVAGRFCVLAFTSPTALRVALRNDVSWVTLTKSIGEQLSAAGRAVVVDPHGQHPILLLSHLIFPAESASE